MSTLTYIQQQLTYFLNSSDVNSRTRALMMYIKIGGLEDTDKAVVSCIKDSHSKVRALASVAAEVHGLKQAIPSLAEGLQDPVHEVRLASCNAIAKLAGKDGERFLTQIVDDADAWIAYSACSALVAHNVATERITTKTAMLRCHPDVTAILGDV